MVVTVQDELVRLLPKAELHVHIEGTFEPELMLEIAERNGLQHKVPFGNVEDARAAYRFNNLQEFLDIYYIGCKVLITQKDFHDLMAAYLTRAAAENVVRAEIFFDPQSHTSRGITWETMLNGFHSAMQEAQQQHGMSTDLIMCFLRHEGAEAAWQTLQEALPFKDRFIAVGLDSSELGFPPLLFTRTYAEAAKHGLRAVAHAGEEGPPEYVWAAIRELKVERIDHGIRSLEDPELVQYLRKTQLPLTVCPFSNVKLKVCPDADTYHAKLADLLGRGLCTCINSDDPAYFGGYVNQNLASVVRTLDLTPERVLELVQNSFRAAFISEEQRTVYLQKTQSVYYSVVMTTLLINSRDAVA